MGDDATASGPADASSTPSLPSAAIRRPLGPLASLLDEPLRSCILQAIDVAGSEGLVDWELGGAQAADVLDGRVLGPADVDCGFSSDDR